MKETQLTRQHSLAASRGWIEPSASRSFSWIEDMHNASGTDITEGAVVVVLSDGTIELADTVNDPRPTGVALDDIDDDDTGQVCFGGPVDLVQVTGSVTAGQYGQTSTTPGEAQVTTGPATAFCMFTDSGTTPSAFLWGGRGGGGVIAGVNIEDLPTTETDTSLVLHPDGAGGVAWSGVGPGEVTADGTPFTISSGVDFRGFPGAAWLTNPTATEHGVGDKFLIVYYHGATHTTGGPGVVGRICTVTSTTPWTYSVGGEFIIDSTGTPRCDDAVSVLDIGGGDYRAVVALREFTGGLSGANNTPRVLVCDDPSSSTTSGSSWTSYNIPLSGHTQDWNVNRVHKLANGRFMVVYGYISGTTHVNGVVWTMDITDWSGATFVPINSSTSALDEIDFEEVFAGTLYANIRNDATGFIDYSVSTDSGDTWSTPVAMFAGTHFPTWRVLNSGLGLITYADTVNFDVTYRQTTSGVTDSGWGAATTLDAGGAYFGAYATILQLDNNHVLVIYGLESTESDPIDSDLYSQVLTDSSTVAPVTALDDLSDAQTTGETAGVGLFFDGSVWRPAYAPAPLLLEDGTVAILEDGSAAMSEPTYI